MRFILYILIVVAVVFLSDFIYVKSGEYQNDIKKCNAGLMFTLDSASLHSNLLYFGESSNFTTAKNDLSQKSISELIGDNNTELRLSPVCMGAIHAGTYRTLIDRLPNQKVKTIIITVNLRSFGINWIESKLETNLDRANVFYSHWPPLLKKLMLSFKVYDNSQIFERNEIIRHHYQNDKFKLVHQDFETVSDWDSYVFDKGVADSTGKKDQVLTNVACHFIKNYAFLIDEHNPRIKDLDYIVSVCREKKINLLFHLLPENYKRARKLCGIDLEVLMRRNAMFLQNRYEKSTTFVNNFELLEDSCFIDRDWPTEHYIYYGRKKVADRIYKGLIK